MSDKKRGRKSNNNKSRKQVAPVRKSAMSSSLAHHDEVAPVRISEMLSNLAQHDVILKLVLERLPVKKIVAFRCVSKGFKAIIDERMFKPACLKPKGLVLTYNQHDRVYLPLTPVLTEAGVLTLEREILQESSGLLLCKPATEWSPSQRSFCVINTGTGTMELVSSSLELTNGSLLRKGTTKNEKMSRRTQLQGYTRQMSTTLAFDPLLRPSSFQLVSVWSHRDNADSKYRIEVFSSKTQSWSLCYRSAVLVHQLEITPSNSMLQKSGIYWNRSVNWCNTEGGLVYYEIDRKRLSSVAPPQFQNSAHNYFNQCTGHLLLVRISVHTGSFVVYDMGLDHSGWQFKYMINLHQRAPELGFQGSSFNVLLAEIGDSESAYVVAHGNRVYLTHHDKMVVKDLGIQLRENEKFSTFKYIDTVPDSCFSG